MALFDERNLKTFLDNMTEDERESFVNGFIELFADTFLQDLKKGNKNPSTAFANMGGVLTIAKTIQLSQQEIIKINNYLSKISPSIVVP